MHADYIQSFMNDKVPVTRGMEITVKKSDETGVELSASIEANINDKGVAFGGSLFSVASLASWAVVDYILQSQGIAAKIFVHTAQTKFLAPVTQDFSVICLAPSAEDITGLFEMIAKKGRGRISVNAQIFENGKLAFESIANYVAVV